MATFGAGRTAKSAGLGVGKQPSAQQVYNTLNAKDFQESVVSLTATPPASPLKGLRHLVDTGATGVWSGQDGKIAEGNGRQWLFTTPTEGMLVWNEATNAGLRYDGAAWGAVLFSTSASESAAGTAEIATQAETNTGTDDLRIVTPAKLKNYAGDLLNLTAVTASGAVTGGSFATPTGTVRPIYSVTTTITHADLTAAATSEAIAIATLPAGTKVILGLSPNIGTLFSGGTVSDLSIDVGFTGGDVNFLAEDIPAFTGDPTGIVYGTDGVAFAADNSNLLKAGTNSTALAALFKATGDNVVNLSAGSITFTVFYALIA